MRITLLAITALAGVLALASCGGESDTSASAADASIDACSLLTPAEIAQATGIAAGAPKDAEPLGGVPACNWPTADSSNAAFLTLLVAPSGNYGTFEAAIAKWQEQADDMAFGFDASDYEEVAGIGDFGAWLREAGMLQAHRGQRMVQISTSVAPDRNQLEASIELARYALARLR